MKEDNRKSQLDDYDVPFCEHQYLHGLCYISLFKFKSFDQFTKPPQILDIRDLKQEDAVYRKRRSTGRFLFK